MRRTTTYPEGSKRAVLGYGGYQAVATTLSGQPPYTEISRQGVYSWYKRRTKNGFPEMEKISETTDHLEGYAFDLEKAKTWYAELQIKRADQRLGRLEKEK